MKVFGNRWIQGKGFDGNESVFGPFHYLDDAEERIALAERFLEDNNLGGEWYIRAEIEQRGDHYFVTGCVAKIA